VKKYSHDQKDGYVGGQTESRSRDLLKGRRGFLASVLAGAGTLALSACGGGDSSAASGAVSSRASAATMGALTTSADGTTIPSATQIIDSSGATWTLSNGVVYRNGAPAGYTAGVNLLLWYNGLVFQRNSDYNWWGWQGNWNQVPGDPRKNGSMFYGINGHINQGGPYAIASMAQQITYLSQLGFTMYRHDVWDANGAGTVATLASQAARNGINILPVLTPNMSGLASESAAYDAGYLLGTTVATTLKGLVKYYECGNELETWMVRGDGTLPSDYNATSFAIARGIIRGMFDGIRAIDSSALLLPAPCGWLHFGFFDMLWNGTAPDGTSGHPLVRWDVTPWHWYSDMGDICHATGGSGTYNILQLLQQKYGKPIWLTEYGVRPSYGTDTQIASYLVGGTMLGEYYSVAAQYGVQSVFLYELFDDGIYGSDGNYGLIQANAVTLKPGFTSVQSFIAAHPH
jgi:hypothetical protein